MVLVTRPEEENIELKYVWVEEEKTELTFPTYVFCSLPMGKIHWAVSDEKGQQKKNDNGFVLVATLLPAFMRRAPGRLPHSFKPLLNPLEFFKSPSNFFNIVIVFSKHMPKLHSTNFPTVLFNTKDDCRPFKEFEVQNDMGDKVSHDTILQRASLT